MNERASIDSERQPAAWDANLEAYPLVVELLSSLRRIVDRAASKVGEGDGGAQWPDEVLDRLRERRDLERDVPRSGAGGNGDDDLLSFATFVDLAEWIRADDDLLELVGRLGEGPDEILGILDDLEFLRHGIEDGRPLGPAGLTTLRDHHHRVGEILQGRKKPTRRPRSAAAGADEPDRDVAKKVSAAKPKKTGKKADESVDQTPDSKDEPAPLEPVVDMKALQTDLEAEHDTKVLRHIHAEVMALAEDVFAGRTGRPRPAWEEIRACGWYDSRRDPRGLDPLGAFHHAVDAWTVEKEAGADGERLRALLVERGFTGLLLSLREMFDTNRF